MVQWIRIHLPMQGTWVDSWSGKIPHATEQLSQYTVTTETAYATTEAYAPRLRSTTQEATAVRSPCTASIGDHHHPTRGSAHSNEDPVQPKVNKINYQK